MQSNRLIAARQKHESVARRLNEINAEMARIEAASNNAHALTSERRALKQQRQGIFARMLRLGKVNIDAPELNQIEVQLAASSGEESKAQDLEEAKNVAIAELQSEAIALHPLLAEASRELVEAQFEAAGDEIKQKALPNFLRACDELAKSYAQLAGLGVAHVEFANDLFQKFGGGRQGLGSAFPAKVLNFSAVGFGLDNGGINCHQIDCSGRIESARADALTRWRST